jgi:hypothetical protein
MRNFARHKETITSSGAPCYLVVASPRITKSARAFLRDEGIGYFDGSGSLFLRLPQLTVLIDKDVESEPITRRKNIYQRASSQVLHALLVGHNREWHINDLAAISNVSPSTAHSVVSELEQIGWMSRTGAGPRSRRQLTEPGELLDAWSARYSLDAYQFSRFHLWSSSPEKARASITEVLSSQGVHSALTLTTGAQYVAPQVSPDPVSYLIVPDVPDVRNIVRSTGAKAVEAGGNICLLITDSRSPLMFPQSIDRAIIASDIQLYLDLFAWPRRGKEQAAELRLSRIGF